LLIDVFLKCGGGFRIVPIQPVEDFVDVPFGKDGIVTRLDREDAPPHGRKREVPAVTPPPPPPSPSPPPPQSPPPFAGELLPQLGVPPFLLAPGFDARRDLPKLDYRDQGSLLAEIRTKLNARFSKRDLKKYDRTFDVVTLIIGAAHVAALALLMTKLLPAWGFVVIMVVTRTSLAGAGHYHLHRKWKDQRRYTMPIGKALFDINYVGTSLIGSDGHVLLHHPYLGSGADVKTTLVAQSMIQGQPRSMLAAVPFDFLVTTWIWPPCPTAWMALINRLNSAWRSS